jgi:replicative DNA helicase
MNHLSTDHSSAEAAGDNLDIDIGHVETDSDLRQFAAEHQYVGALLYLSAEHASPLLELVPDTAINRPVTRWAYELIRFLVGQDRPADPVSVLAAGRHRPAAQSLDPRSGPSARQLHELAMYLADAYTESIGATFVDRFARQVLDDAYRRGFAALGQRMQRLAETGAERVELAEQFDAIREQLTDLWRRCEAGASPTVCVRS